MGAPELLHHLRGAGLVLTLTPAGGLHVAPRSALTDDHRAAIRAERDALVLALQAEADQPPPPPPRRSGNPLLTPEQGDECHAGGWDDAEIDAFLAREARFTRMGRAADAEHLAERLTLRDREHDDRRLCLECAALADNGRCLVAARGRLPGASRRLEPVPTILQRCEGFNRAPGLT
jgi:hypothetical protein